MVSERDSDQDRQIRENAERIARNEEALRRQTEALEKIRDHYYPPPAGFLKRGSAFFVKVVCVIVAYLGIAETVDWLWKTRTSEALAERYAASARRLFFEEGDAAGATYCYEKAAGLDPDESEYAMAQLFMKSVSLVSSLLGAERELTDAEQARVDATLSEASVFREMRPDDPMPNVLMAQALFLSGEGEEAVAAVERAVACAPANASVRVSACAIHAFAGHSDEAKRHLDEAGRLDGTLPLVHCWRGMLALRGGDAASARRHFEAMTRRAPRLAVGHASLGWALLAGEKPDVAAARAAFRRAVVLDAKHPGAMLGLSETYAREGNSVVARLWLDRLLALEPNHSKVLVRRAALAVRSGDPSAAIADLTKAVGLAPFRADLYRLRADAREKAGEAAGAAADRKTAEALEMCDPTNQTNRKGRQK